MQKSQITNGMILVRRNYSKLYIIENEVFIGKDTNILSLDYNYMLFLEVYDDKGIHKYDKNKDIMIIKDMFGNILWEREEDWSSVPVGTIVKVKNRDEESWKTRRFVCTNLNVTSRFKVLSDDLSSLETWEECRLV